MNTLVLRALAGLFFLTVVIALLLFLPAGTLHYWQAWMFLITFFIAVLLITVYLIKNDPKLLERRMKAGPAAEKERNQKMIQSAAQGAFILMFIIPALDIRFGWSFVPAYISIFGDALVVLGLFIVFLVFKENSFTSAIISVDSNQRVITTGPYHVVRHPMYCGAMIMLLGTPLALGSWWGLFACIPIFVVIVVRLLDEERFLLKNLEGYKKYSNNTRFHLIPYIW